MDVLEGKEVAFGQPDHLNYIETVCALKAILRQAFPNLLGMIESYHPHTFWEQVIEVKYGTPVSVKKLLAAYQEWRTTSNIHGNVDFFISQWYILNLDMARLLKADKYTRYISEEMLCLHLLQMLPKSFMQVYVTETEYLKLPFLVAKIKHQVPRFETCRSPSDALVNFDEEDIIAPPPRVRMKHEQQLPPPYQPLPVERASKSAKKQKKKMESPMDDDDTSGAQMVILEDGSEGWVVDRILSRRVNRKRKRREFKYLVKWKGVPQTEATWEPMKHLTNIADMVAEYNKRRALTGGRQLKRERTTAVIKEERTV